MTSYPQLSYRFFGRITRSLKVYFFDVKDDLHKANMNYTLDEYLSMAMMTCFIAFVFENILLAFIFGLFTSVVFSLLLSLTLSLTLTGVLFFLFYSYPATMAKAREGKINKSLPFAVSYLATISSAKVQPIVLFETLAQFKEYGEITEEAKTIVRDVKSFGMTFSTAIAKRAKRTPSADFRELLWGINTIVSSGGELTSFLKQKSNEYMNDYRGKIKKYANNLTLFVEVYLTLIITGSIFFMVLSSIINTISGGLGTTIIQSFVVLILLPLISIGFIIMIKSISPE